MRRFRKTVSEGAEVTSDGKLFHRRLPNTGNARSPTVDSCVQASRTTMTGGDGGWNRRRAGCGQNGTVAPDGASIVHGLSEHIN